MKRCPFCSEEIQDTAVKCRYCGERLDRRSAVEDDLDRHPTERGPGGALSHDTLDAAVTERKGPTVLGRPVTAGDLVTLLRGRGMDGARPSVPSVSPVESPSGAGRVVLPPDLIEVPDVPYASLDGLASGSREAQDCQRRAVVDLGLPLEVKTAKTGIVFRVVPAGSFTMGSPSGETNRESNETQHQVTLTKAFYCGKYEVTQGRWEAVMGSNPSSFKNAGPVTGPGVQGESPWSREERNDEFSVRNVQAAS